MAVSLSRIGVVGILAGGYGPGNVPFPSPGPIVQEFNTPGTFDVRVPLNRTHCRVQLWGAGAGGGGSIGLAQSAGGGGGGGYAESTVLVVPGSTMTGVLIIGAGGSGGLGGVSPTGGDDGEGTSWDGAVVACDGGYGNPNPKGGGVGGNGVFGDVQHSGGYGADELDVDNAGGGGGSAGPLADGQNAFGPAGGVAVAGGGAGGDGAGPPVVGGFPGGGGGGAQADEERDGAAGAGGRAVLSFYP